MGKARTKQPKARVKRILKKREPQLVEGPKNALFLRAQKCSEGVQELLKDLARLKAPLGKALSKRNDIRPFEAAESLEFLCQKNDCALFAMGSHSKKRPNNLVLGRTFDGQVLDLVELGVEFYRPLASFGGGASKARGAKPMMIFCGDEWATSEPLGQIKNLLLDFFRGPDVDKVALSGLDHVMQCAVEGGKIRVRHYTTLFKDAGARVPRIELAPMGPSMDLTVRRTKFAAPDLARLARRKPKGLAPKKQKNVTRNEFGDKVGRLYVDKQDVSKMQVRRTKALRTTAKELRANRRARGSGSGSGSADGAAEGAAEGGRAAKRARSA